MNKCFIIVKFITDVTKIKVSHCEFKLVKFDDADEEYSICDDLLKQKGIQYHIAEKNEYASKNILVTFPDKDIKRTDVQELIEIINVLVDAKPKVNLKNGDLVYLVITVDNRKPADNEQYLLSA